MFAGLPINDHTKHATFLASPRKHIVMISSHGIHQWEVIPGLPDTGGQNVFINQFSAALVDVGFKVTIANRGGYKHPQTGELHTGLRYRDENERILYLEDGDDIFIRKEEMKSRLPALTTFLRRFLDAEQSLVALMITHYWDAGRIGMLLNKDLPRPIPHIWVPHSLGSLKKRNVSPTEAQRLHLEERIDLEKALIREVNGVAATSVAIRVALQQDYGYVTSLLLPPCIEKERFHPREIRADDPIWEFLSAHSEAPAERIRTAKIVTEISRTDRTKQKHLLLHAFAAVHRRDPKTFLIITIDDSEEVLSTELRGLIKSLGIADSVAILGSVAEQLPHIYAVTAAYCTPSLLEDFGISVQEAAATGVPAVTSTQVPYAVEYLLTNAVDENPSPGDPAKLIKTGAGAIVVEPDDLPGLTHALLTLLSDDSLRKKMGDRALRITIPYFTWNRMVRLFFDRFGMPLE